MSTDCAGKFGLSEQIGHDAYSWTDVFAGHGRRSVHLGAERGCRGARSDKIDKADVDARTQDVAERQTKGRTQ